MKLYRGPHTCAIGIHILLEEIGAPYETTVFDVGVGGKDTDRLKAVNPKGKVPTLIRDDGSMLTEFGAIATWLARTHPQAGLIPDDAEGEARVTEMLEYVTGTIHGQGFGRLFKPEKYEPQDLVHSKLGLGRASVEQQGKEMIDEGFAIVDPALAHHPYVAGDRLTIADAALFYVERWSAPKDIVLPARVQAHFERMLARPAVQRVRAAWGES